MPTTIYNARVILPDRILDRGRVRIEGARIAGVEPDPHAPAGPETLDARGLFLAPGFIDLHMHLGYLGLPWAAELELCGRQLPANGTTRFLATLVSAREGNLPEAFAAIRRFQESGPTGARPLGAHLEGPYIAPAARGGFLLSQIASPAEYDLRDVLDEGRDLVRIVTLSPELPGAPDVIADCVRRGIVVAFGHSVGGPTDYQAARAAGATHCAHTYNNRRTFPDSPKGGRGFTIDDLCVADDGVTCELICDGAHVQPVWVKTIARTKGVSKICLVTDSFLAGRRGAEGETFQTAGGQPITVRDGVGRDGKGGLAGSVLTQDRAVRNFVRLAGVALPEAVRCASLNPARVLGVDQQFGSVETDKIADLVLVDDEFNPVLTLVEGEIAFDKRKLAG